MKIAHINLSDVREGVSGTIRTLMDAQIAHGDQPFLFCAFQGTPDNEIRLMPQIQNDPWQHTMESFESRTGLFGLSATRLMNLWRHPDFEQADIVHLHVATSNYFSYLLLPSLASKPLVWSIYDAQPFTGGCSHTAICERWKKQQCESCPQVPTAQQPHQRDLYRFKEALYGITPMAIVTPNMWLTEQVKTSILSNHFVTEIQPAIDLAFLQRVDRQKIRQRMSIPQEAFVIAFASPGGLTNPLYGGMYLQKVLNNWKDDNRQVVVLLFGCDDKDSILPPPFTSHPIPLGISPLQRSAVLQASDVFLQLSPHDATALYMLEAAAAGVPPVAFPVSAAGSMVRHLEDGYLSSYSTVEGIINGLRFLRNKPRFLRQIGEQAARRVWQRHQPEEVANAYRNLYEEMVSGSKIISLETPQSEAISSIPRSGLDVEELLKMTGISRRVGQLLEQGIPEKLWSDLTAQWDRFPKEREWERGVFVDLYLTCVIQQTQQPMFPMLLVETISQWFRLRQLPARCGNFSPTEKLALHAWTKAVRYALTNFLQATPIEFFRELSSYQQGCLINLWRILFFNDFATPYLEEDLHKKDRRNIEATTSPRRIYPDLLLRSMYTPYPPESVKLDMVRLLKPDIPIALQVILAFWIVSAPYYTGDEKSQRIMRRNVTAFLQGAMQTPETLPAPFYNGVVDYLVPQFWRAAYMGGNLVKELTLFGDFLHQQMKRFHPTLVEVIPPTPLNDERRLRIGYFSSNFYRQAVSFYMANRFFYADRQKFEIQVFSLEKRHDNLTDRIKGYSDRFTTFNNPADLSGMAQTIKNSGLDILIFADIGMDSVTYQLAAMRLAPVQCVLVGHAATTGLPTIDYYISGDFEAPNAQDHYREKLVKLPNLGAAQMYPPFPPTGKLTRQDFELPEEFVLLVSCANGIKHGCQRDKLLVRILQQAPNAMIVLKPFMDPSMVHIQWIERIQNAAREGGVADRLRIIKPLAQSQHLLDFLSLADIQLDTYPYGGWTTNMEAVYAGLAIVTQEGDQARTRWGSHILRALGVKAGIARNEEEYVRQAVELATNRELREQVRKQIKERACDVLFNGAAAQADYEAELMRIYTDSLQHGK
ncbi:MAG: glycosyltransferase [Veillonellaceae bacterium]|nr:glycosyltransferase [Veillonellaceae bacterium]